MQYIDVAFALNKTIHVSLLTTINSIVKNTSNPAIVRFNVVVPPNELSFFSEIVESTFPNRNFTIRIETFTPPEYVGDYLNCRYPEQSADRRMSRRMQFSRFFLKDIFPDISKIIYLDTDLIVLKDISTLFNAVETFTAEQYFAAAPQYLPPIAHFNNICIALRETKGMKDSFNSGVFLTDFYYWDDATYSRLKYYLNLDAKNNYKLYRVGDESILNLMFKNFIPLDRNWNCSGFGNARPVARLLKCDLKKANIIHWSGGYHKPWRTDRIMYGELWRSYNPLNSSFTI
jgi:lipopolysaccharide biosynthesis glycosyltransferase